MRATFPYIIHHNEKKSNQIVLMCSNRLLSFTKYGQENSTKYKLKREKKIINRCYKSAYSILALSILS